MARGSTPRHLEDSDKHKSSIAINLRHWEADTSHHERLQPTYTYTSYASFNSHLADPSPSTQIGLFDSDNRLEPDLGHQDYDFPVSAGIGPHQHDAEAEREQLHCEVELMIMEAEQLDEMGLDQLEDDPTVTNVAHELNLLGTCIHFIVWFTSGYSFWQNSTPKTMMSPFRIVLQRQLTVVIMLRIQISLLANLLFLVYFP